MIPETYQRTKRILYTTAKLCGTFISPIEDEQNLTIANYPGVDSILEPSSRQLPGVDRILEPSLPYQSIEPKIMNTKIFPLKSTPLRENKTINKRNKDST